VDGNFLTAFLLQRSDFPDVWDGIEDDADDQREEWP
jgi:hypothetical protein